MSYLEPYEYETENAKVKVTFANVSDEEREIIFKNLAHTIYELRLSEYKKEMGLTNENEKGTNG